MENDEDLKTDFENISSCFNLLQEDYLGGHGTRGYGRVAFDNLEFEFKNYNKDYKNDVKTLAEKIIKVG